MIARQDLIDIYIHYVIICKTLIKQIDNLVLNSDLLISSASVDTMTDNTLNILENSKDGDLLIFSQEEFQNINITDKRDYLFFQSEDGQRMYGFKIGFKVDTSLYNDIDINNPDKESGLITSKSSKDRINPQIHLSIYKDELNKEDRPYFKTNNNNNDK